jgi:uncharacterized protein
MSTIRTVRVLLIWVAIGLTAGAAIAQTKAPTPDPAAIAAAKELMLAAGVNAQMETVISTMTKGMAQAVRQQHPAKGKEIDEVFAALAKKFRERQAEMIELVAPLYAEKFTVPELKEIGAFYRTPIGIKLLATQPEIMQRSMQIGMGWGQKIGQEVEAEARTELKKRGVEL